jgi:hypothetical protein
MPVTPSCPPPPSNVDKTILPDYVPTGHESHAVTISMEAAEPDWDPAWASLPPEEQERLRLRWRFLGIRLRGDIRDTTVPINRKTSDIP